MDAKKILYLLPVCVAFYTCLFALTSDTALAKRIEKTTVVIGTSEKSLTRDATVNLYCRVKARGKTFSVSGSGVVISDRGVILTNAHVAQTFLLINAPEHAATRCIVRTGSPATERYTASLLYLPTLWIEENTSKFSKKPPRVGENDFALLYITNTKKDVLPEHFPYLPINSITPPAEQEVISIAGYPTENLDFEKIQRSLMLVSASSSITNIQSYQAKQPDILTLTPSAAGSPGVSGGPIINTSGEVVGIVTSKSARKNDRTLRGITLDYIDRVMYSTESVSLTTLLTENFATRASTTQALFPPQTIKRIETSLFKKK